MQESEKREAGVIESGQRKPWAAAGLDYDTNVFAAALLSLSKTGVAGSWEGLLPDNQVKAAMSITGSEEVGTSDSQPHLTSQPVQITWAFLLEIISQWVPIVADRLGLQGESQTHIHTLISYYDTQITIEYQS